MPRAEVREVGLNSCDPVAGAKYQDRAGAGSSSNHLRLRTANPPKPIRSTAIVDGSGTVAVRRQSHPRRRNGPGGREKCNERKLRRNPITTAWRAAYPTQSARALRVVMGHIERLP